MFCTPLPPNFSFYPFSSFKSDKRFSDPCQDPSTIKELGNAIGRLRTRRGRSPLGYTGQVDGRLNWLEVICSFRVFKREGPCTTFVQITRGNYGVPSYTREPPNTCLFVRRRVSPGTEGWEWGRGSTVVFRLKCLTLIDLLVFLSEPRILRTHVN